MATHETRRILLVEDTPSMAMLYTKLLEREGLEVTVANDAASGRAGIVAGGFDAYVLDMMLPDGNGLDLLELVTERTPSIPAIVVTADGSINRAVEAMRLGAFDFMVKPFSETAFVSATLNAAQTDHHAAPVPAPVPDAARVVRQEDAFHGFVGASAPMKELYGKIERLGRSNASVFITGESGTGKEVCAEAIHRISGRMGKPLIALNCGAIPAELLESEVFGHLKGSFTGAIANKPGAARAADGGTLFLDEICELPLALQTKLLRFLQTSTVTPVGGTEPVPVDVRIICATNRNPVTEVREGRFREDLFFRLHVVPLELPPLRARGDDIMLLARYFLRKFAKAEGKRLDDFERAAVARLTAMRWDGNVRQLENLMRMIVAVHDGAVVTADMLPPEIETAVIAPPTDGAAQDTPRQAQERAAAPLEQRVAPLVGEELASVEQALIEATIAVCGGSVPKAARTLNVSPSTIYRKRENWAARAASA